MNALALNPSVLISKISSERIIIVNINVKYDNYLFDEIRVGHIRRNKFFSL